MLVFDWLEQTDNIGCNILPARMTCAELCCQIVGNTFLNFVPNFSLEGGNWVIYVYDNTIFLKYLYHFNINLLLGKAFFALTCLDTDIVISSI